MKKINIILTIFAIAVLGYIAFIFLKVKTFVDTYSYRIRFNGIDSATFKNLLNLNEKSWVSVDYSIFVKNNSDFTISLAKLNIVFYYLGIEIGRSIKSDTIDILPMAETEIRGEGKIFLNKSAINMLAKIGLGETVNIAYEVDTRLSYTPFSVPFKGQLQYSRAQATKDVIKDVLPIQKTL